MSFSGSSNDDVDSEPPMDVVYPVGEEVEVPGTQGGLFKTVLVEGTGTKPINNSRVSVHYVGTLEDGTKFDSSRDRGEYFEFTIGKGQVIKGWDKGVATMRVGEKACLRCLSHYGYGAAGSPPSIPPNATLLFEVELFDWTCSEDISTKKDKSLMKQVFVEGVGYQKAEFDSDVTLDLRVYVGNYTPNKDDLQPVRVETNWSFRIGQVELPPFLEETLATMRKQESAAVVVRSDILPPDCDHRDTNRTYLVEIHDLKRVQPWEVKGMGLVEEALQRKDMGNAALKDGKLKLSEKYYRRALEFGESGTASEDTVKEECTKAQIAILGNLAQVLLMNKQYRDAVVYSKKVLDLDGGNTKALYRLAKAQDALKEWDEAAEAVGKLLAREPNNADAQALRAHVIAEKKAFDKSQKDTYKKMFS